MKLIKVGFSGGGLGKANGSEVAPDEIVNALYDLYSSEDGFFNEFQIENVDVVNSNIIETNKRIFDKIKSLNKCILLGGDHSITYSSFKAFVLNHPDAGMIIFDAHPDCENNFSPPTQEDYLKVLIEEGFLNPAKVILIGLRNWHENEIKYLKEKGIFYFNMKKMFDLGVNEVCSLVMERALLWSSVYVSVDIDVVDPAFAPGTGYCEPGGLTSREIIYFLQRIKKMRNVGMFDIVEVCPKLDVNGLTVKLAAKLVREVL